MDPSVELKAWRTEAGRTVVSCAKEVSVSHPTWLDWEGGKKRPRIEHAIRIEEITNGRVKVTSWALAAPADHDGFAGEVA